MSDGQNLYDKRGVSASKDEVHKAIENLDKGLFPKAFCKVLPDITGGDPEYCNIMHADTAGTKTSLAYLYWKETDDLSVWSDVVIDAIVMNLDDMACVGCLDNIILSSTIGRNKRLIPAEVLSKLINGTSDFLSKLESFGIHVTLAGGETADVGDIVRTVDVGFTTFARMKRNDLVVNNIRPGDYIVGLASDGKALYESSYNGGMGSNGLTSARHDVFHKKYAQKYPEIFDPNLPDDVVFTGSKNVDDVIEIAGEKMTVGKLVLSPTRTYMPVLKEVLSAYKASISGIIHCSGGGQTKVIKFLDKVRVVKDNLFALPPLFKLIQEESGTSWKEMYQVFNMGQRLEIFTDKDTAQDILNISKSFNIDAVISGYVENADKKEVIIENNHGTFTYS
ncbi:MAG TPA: AIR synthase-related protein [Saprospiraceae bacterium]|nr:AIR synthase-related protein [Saprospiraceae bacterium]